MHKPRILIIGGSGNTGLPTALQLAREGFPVTALVRREDSRSAELRSNKVKVIVGSMLDIVDMRLALEGVKRVYFCTPAFDRSLTAAATFISAALEHQVEHVVAMSQWLSSPVHPSQHTRATWLSDRLLSLIPGCALTLLNPGYFADNEMQVLTIAAQFGVMMLPYGDGKNAPPSNEDMARVAAEILARPDGHEGKSYRITGPKLLSPKDIAAIVSKVLGRKIRYVNAPIWMIQKVVVQMGFGEYLAAQMASYSIEYQKGSFALSAPTDVVQQITGREAEDYETIVRRYAAKMPDIQPGIWSKWKLFAIANAAMFRRAPDRVRYLASDDFSNPEHSSLDANSPEWLQIHSREAIAVHEFSKLSQPVGGQYVARRG